MNLKERWKLAEQIAEVLKVHKNDVHNYLLSKIIAAGKIQDTLNGEAETMAWIKALPEWEQIKSKFVETPAEQLKLAMWFIAKFELPEQAVKAVEVAMKAIEGLKK